MKSFSYKSVQALNCSTCKSPVIIKLDPSKVLDGTAYIEGQIGTAVQYFSTDGSTYYQYGIIYNEAQLVDPVAGITPCDVLCLFCKDCLGDWLQFNLDELEQQIIDSQVQISEDAGNIIEMRTDGLYAAIPERVMYTPFTTLTAPAIPTSIKASAGAVHGWYLHNNSTAVRYVKLWDSAVAIDPSAGGVAPVLTIALPKGQAANAPMPDGIEFVNGIQLSVTQLPAANDETAMTAGDVIVNLFYS